jgi:hypothetical protein
VKQDQVHVGQTYSAKVGGGVVPVKITEEKWRGDKHTGWVGVNTLTNRKVYIQSALRLRAAVGAGAPVAAPGGDANVDDESGGGVVLAKAGSPAPRRPAKGAKGQKAKGASKPKAATKEPKARAPKPDRPLSGLDAAAKVLVDAGEPMRVGDIFAAIQTKGLWATKGKTPEATLYAAIIREIRDKGVDSRFEKKDRGLFKAMGK